MSGYRGHLVGGVVTFVIVRHVLIPLTSYSVPQETVCLALTLFGALFPDVDIKSKGQQVFYMLALVIAAMAFTQRAWNSLAWLLLMCFFPLAVVHRGPMHNPYVLIATPWIIARGLQGLFPTIHTLSPMYHMFFIAGALSHLVLDYGLIKALKKFLPPSFR
jgi:hypothetical protein